MYCSTSHPSTQRPQLLGTVNLTRRVARRMFFWRRTRHWYPLVPRSAKFLPLRDSNGILLHLLQEV